MGYTTDFSGGITISPPVEPEHRDYINAFADTRRMKRDPATAELSPDPKRLAVGLPIGEDGEYFVGGDGLMGQGTAGGVVNYNSPPANQPGLWCQWEVGEDSVLRHNEGEKFYNYVEWLEYLIEHFFSRWGYRLTGTITWQGEESDDRGSIYVKNNIVEAVEDVMTNPGPSWERNQ